MAAPVPTPGIVLPKDVTLLPPNAAVTIAVGRLNKALTMLVVPLSSEFKADMSVALVQPGRRLLVSYMRCKFTQKDRHTEVLHSVNASSGEDGQLSRCQHC